MTERYHEIDPALQSATNDLPVELATGSVVAGEDVAAVHPGEQDARPTPLMTKGQEAILKRLAKRGGVRYTPIGRSAEASIFFLKDGMQLYASDDLINVSSSTENLYPQGTAEEVAEHRDLPAILLEIHEAVERRKELEEAIAALGAEARRQGATYADLAHAAGITQPAAYQRWSEGGKAKHAARQRAARRAD
ncbi:MAG: hypothetical protein JWM81_1148 [Candidatus Saccharibacteria bacterium]|nr:hypothetical protein [Candidatus Saccharibacteria bacterium]